MSHLTGKTIAILATDEFEDSELSDPLEALREAGATVEIVSIDGSGEIKGKNGTTIEVDRDIVDVTADEYDGLMLPGGVGNPDKLRMDSDAVGFVKDFFDSQKPVAAICHAPWMLIEADVVKGRTLTSWPSLKTDIKNAGGTWVGEEVVVDEGLVTSRNPDDLPAFCDKAIEEFAEGEHAGQLA